MLRPPTGTASVVAMGYSVYADRGRRVHGAFYEGLFAGDSVASATLAGRRQLKHANRRPSPSPKGEMELQDWMVPVVYVRRDVHFPDLKPPARPPELSLEEALGALRRPRGLGRR